MKLRVEIIGKENDSLRKSTGSHFFPFWWKMFSSKNILRCFVTRKGFPLYLTQPWDRGQVFLFLLWLVWSASDLYFFVFLIFELPAEGLNLPYLSAFLDSIGSNFSHGANFATAGSTIRPQNTTMAQSGYSPISLDVQGVQFSDFHTRSQIIRQKGTSFIVQTADENSMI